MLRKYPQEKELQERVRLYLNICRRHVTPHEAAPQTVDERLYASTLAINGGQYDQAIVHLCWSCGQCRNCLSGADNVCVRWGRRAQPPAPGLGPDRIG